MTEPNLHQPPENIYPKLSVEQIQNPNRFYAVPFFGFVIKLIMIIPIGIELIFLCIAQIFINIINSLVVLFTGKYWGSAYSFNLGVMRLTTKLSLFFLGLTDKYPGFGFTIDDPLIKLDMEMPQSPNRFFAIPIIGGLARFILLIPYFIYQSVIQNAAWLGAVIISFKVLFTGKYPESVYEIARDSVRLSQAESAYLYGFSDSYPNFWISMNHQTIKLLLIIFSALTFFGQGFSGYNNNYMPENVAPVEESLPIDQNTY